MLGKLKVVSGLLLIFCHIFAVGMLVLFFHLNRSYIAENLCKNRIYKSNTCQGQCFFQETLSLLEGEPTSARIDLLLVLDNYLMPEFDDIKQVYLPLSVLGPINPSLQFFYGLFYPDVDSPPPESYGEIYFNNLIFRPL